MYYVHKYKTSLEYGGPEEGGWWYDTGIPVASNLARFTDEDEAYAYCRRMNEQEMERRENEEQYEYTSVCASYSTHYDYMVEDEPVAKAFPENRPHYE